MRYARVTNGIVAEIITLENGVDIAAMFHPDIAKTMFECGAEVVEGWTYKKGSFSPPPVEEIDLDALKAALRTSVDTAAETARAKYITPGAGQAMTYQEKFSELLRYEADTNPVKAGYPMLSAEIGITADSLMAVAAAVRAAYNLWKQIGGAIELARLTAKRDIDRASTVTAAQAAADVTWP